MDAWQALRTVFAITTVSITRKNTEEIWFMALLYAITGNMERARLMLEARVPYLQLRFKSTPLEPHYPEITGWGAEYPETRLIINDDLDAALAVRSWGLHLGQEDLARYPAEKLRYLPLHLGVSTHDDGEIAHALTFNPAMIGFGPIYPTATKTLTNAPQGVQRLAVVVAGSPVPVVAIGGITAANLGEVAGTGVGMIAMIAQLDACQDPADVRDLMTRMSHPSDNF